MQVELKLNIEGLFESENEVREVVNRRKICYDTEPYYFNRKGKLVQIGYQLSIYGTFAGPVRDATPDTPGYEEVESDVRRLAEAVSHTCSSLHTCESTIPDPSQITYSHERKMRPDVTVHIPVFDQNDFGHPVDSNVTEVLKAIVELLESLGVRKTQWHD
jgi:hypothetical protein